MPYKAGHLTAGRHAHLVKQNEQADSSDPATEQADRIIRQAIQKHALFQSACLPQQIRPLLFVRYRDSTQYGSHVDDAIMGSRRCAPILLSRCF